MSNETREEMQPSCQYCDNGQMKSSGYLGDDLRHIADMLDKEVISKDDVGALVTEYRLSEGTGREFECFVCFGSGLPEEV